MKVWITTYALTSGIFSVETKSGPVSGMISYKREADQFTSFVHGKDWHSAEEDAIARGEEMKAKKLESLRKQIAKLEKLKIEVMP